MPAPWPPRRPGSPVSGYARIDRPPTVGAACHHAKQAAAAPSRPGRRRPVPPAGRGRQGLRDLPARPRRPGGQLERGRRTDQGVHGRRDPGPGAQPVLRTGRRRRRPPGHHARPGGQGRPRPGSGLAARQGRPPLLRPGRPHGPVRRPGPAQRVRQGHPGRDRRAGGRAGPPRPGVPARRGAAGRQAGQLRMGAGQRPGDLEQGAVPDPRHRPRGVPGHHRRAAVPDPPRRPSGGGRDPAPGGHRRDLVPHAGADRAAHRRAAGPVRLGRRHPRRAGPAVADARGLPGRHRLAPARGAAHRRPGPGRAVAAAAERAAAQPLAARPGVGAAHPVPAGARAGAAGRGLLRRPAAGRRHHRPADRRRRRARPGRGRGRGRAPGPPGARW